MLLTSFTSLYSTHAYAEIRTFAVFIANHKGNKQEAPLRYAARDADRLQSALIETGGWDKAEMFRVIDENAPFALQAIREMGLHVADAKRKGHQTIALVYYSGHAQSGTLHLGSSRLAMDDLKAALEETRADVRLAVVDACGAGSLTAKGAQVAPPFLIGVEHSLSATGQVLIASSSADEVSQESDELQGSFFTHFFSTGLRGAADTDHDGVVTLNEAYTYAHGRTVAATVESKGGIQHPIYSLDLQGGGEVILTKPSGSDVVIRFPEELAGRYFVLDADKNVFVAELSKSAGRSSQISLPKGTYVIKKRDGDRVLLQNIKARSKGTFTVDENTMQSLALEQDYAKGSPINYDDIARLTAPPVRHSIGIGLGGQAAFEDATQGALFPSIPMASLEWTGHNLLSPALSIGIDANIGARPVTRTLPAQDFGFADDINLQTQYGQYQLGASLLYQQTWDDFSDQLTASWAQAFLPATTLIRTEYGVRLSMLGAYSRFTDVDPDTAELLNIQNGKIQSLQTMMPSVSAAFVVDFDKHFSLQWKTRATYLLYTIDENRSIGLLESFLTTTYTF